MGLKARVGQKRGSGVALLYMKGERPLAFPWDINFCICWKNNAEHDKRTRQPEGLEPNWAFLIRYS